MISEKGLTSAMKAEYKKTGYTVLVEENQRTTIRGLGWSVIADLARVPRKCLALMVEHMGRLPDLGIAYRVMKDNVQQLMTAAEIAESDRIEESTDRNKTVRKTALTLGGATLWQEEETGKIHGTDPENERVVDFRVEDWAQYSESLGCLMIHGEDSTTTISTMEPAEEIRDYLSHREWV